MFFIKEQIKPTKIRYSTKNYQKEDGVQCGMFAVVWIIFKVQSKRFVNMSSQQMKYYRYLILE
jgi:hypothetical protein